MTTFATVELAFCRARDFMWDPDENTIGLLLTNLLVDAGLVVDDQIGRNSIEARIHRAFREVQDTEEGNWWNCTDLVAECVMRHLGIAEDVAA